MRNQALKVSKYFTLRSHGGFVECNLVFKEIILPISPACVLKRRRSLFGKDDLVDTTFAHVALQGFYSNHDDRYAEEAVGQR